MAQDRPSPLSLAEKLDFLVTILRTASVAAWTLLTSPFRGKYGHNVFWKHVVHRAVRTMNTRASARQIQAISLTAEAAYLQYAKAKGFSPTSISLRDGAKGHWIGSPSARNVLVFFPGGGFVYPAADAQYEFLGEVQKAAGSNCAAVLLDAGMAPGKQYPVQLQQAIDLLRHLVHDAGKKVGNMVLAGDSAGANLALSVMSHLLHPHPSIEPLAIEGHFQGALLISPWVSFSASTPSYSQNGYRDITDATILRKWGQYYLGKAPPDKYNEPIQTDAAWWKDLGNKVPSICITAGSDETPFSDIEKFVQTLKEAKIPALEVTISKGETHDQPFMAPLIGDKTEGQSMLAAKSWLASKL